MAYKALIFCGTGCAGKEIPKNVWSEWNRVDEIHRLLVVAGDNKSIQSHDPQGILRNGVYRRSLHPGLRWREQKVLAFGLLD